MNNLIQKKDNPKIKKRLNLISSLDNYDSVNYNTCLTEGNNNSNIDKDYNKNKKNEIKECISKKLNSTNYNKMRKMMDQSSTLFDNQFYASNYTGNKIFLKI